MSNTPQNYGEAGTNNLADKRNAEMTDQGFWQAPGYESSDTYASVTDPNCPERVTAHYIDGSIYDISSDFYLSRAAWRRLQSMLDYHDHLCGARWATIGSSYGGSGLTPACTMLGQFQVMSVTPNTLGSTITLRCGWQGDEYSNGPIDPSNLEIWSQYAYPDDGVGVIERSAQSGSIQAGDLVTFQNSVVTDTATQRSRIEPMILKHDFSNLPATPEITDTWTIDVDQDCSVVVNELLPDDPEKPVLATIYSMRRERPMWFRCDDSHPLLAKVKTVEITAADWGSGKSYELLDHDGEPCRIRFPIAQSQMRTGIAGTIYIERDTGDGYVDITDQFASTLNGTAHFPRVVISGRRGVDERTDIYLGPRGEDDPTDYTDGAVGFRILYWPEFIGEGSVSGMPDRCGMSEFDENETTYNRVKPGAVPVDMDDHGRHWYCAARPVVPSPFATNYTHDCAQTGCPQFRIRQPQAPSQLHTAQITSGVGSCQYQLSPGGSGAMAYVDTYIDAFGIQFAFNPPDAYQSNYDTGYLARRLYRSGLFVMVDEDDPITTDEEGNESIKFVRGALFNFNADFEAIDWETARWPDDIKGVLQRRLSTIANTPFGEFPDGTNDPMGVINAERLGRVIAPVRRDCQYPGSDFAFTAYSQPGLLSEERAMRLRQFYRYLVNVNLDQTGTQGDARDASIVIYSSPRTVYGIENVRAVLTFRGL